MAAKSLAYYLGIKYPVAVQESPDGGYFVTNPDLDGCMAEGSTLEEAFANLADSRELWIESRLAKGYPLPEPVEEEYSGKLSLRMAPSLHARLADIAKRQGISLNLLINTALASFAGGEDTLHSAMSEFREMATQARAAYSLLVRTSLSDMALSGGLAQPSTGRTGNVVHLKDWRAA
jgi:antitoxin HicB